MLWWLAQNTLTAAVLAALVALLCRFVRLNPAMKHALWLVVLVKLVAPPVLEWPWRAPEFASFFHAGTATPFESVNREENSQAAAEVFEVFVRSAEAPAEAEDPLPFSADSPTTIAVSPMSQAESALWQQPAWLTLLLLCVWLAGTVVMLGLQLLRIARFRRLLLRGEHAPLWLAKQVEKLAAKLLVRRPRTQVVPGIGSPCVWNLGKPTLLWPESLEHRLPSNRRRSVIVHELAHLRRRDHWVGWLVLLAECLWWWNPLFWLVRRQLRFNAELACDAWVVATLPLDRRAYAEALIEVTQHISRTAAPVPALGMSSGARQDFERRLTMIMCDRVSCKVPVMGLVTIGLLALLALPCVAQVQPNEQKVEEVKKELVVTEGIVNLTATVDDVEKATRKVTAEVLNLVEVAADAEEPQKPEVKRVPVVVRGQVREVKQPGDAERDQRLQALEKQIQALLKEVQSLRAGTVSKLAQPHAITFSTVYTAKEAKPAGAASTSGVPKPTAAHQPLTLTLAAPKPDTAPVTVKIESAGQTTVGLITLSRATYKLPNAKARALVSFLQQHGKVQILETKVEDDNLIVTTTPEAQKAIGQFINLIQGVTARSGTSSSGTSSGGTANTATWTIGPEESWKAYLGSYKEFSAQPHIFWQEWSNKAKPKSDTPDKKEEPKKDPSKP